MKQGIPFYKYMISMICVAIIFGGGGILFQRNSDAQAEKSETATDGDELQKVHDLYQTVTDNYYKDVDKEKLIEGALSGMAEALDDPYTTYLNQEDATELNQSLSDSFEGIGATLALVDKIPQIAQAPIKGTPAEKAGLRAKDQILKVDDKETAGKELTEVVQEIRGEKGTKVKLTIQRGQKQFTVTLVRDTIPLETVHGEIAADHPKVGVIQITSFGEGTTNELKTAIEALRKDGATSFLLDVRQNPGGLLDQVEQMSSMFLENGKTIVEFADSEGVVSTAKASEKLDNGFKVKEPVVVLVDSGSASAAEIFAAALKESANVQVIGTTTFGKGTVQSIADLGDESEIKLTIMKWLTPSGDWIHEKGLKPTIEADYPKYAYLPPLPRDETLKVGQNSDDVSTLNQFLNALGYDTSGSLFNEKTSAAVKELQEKYQLDVTGEVEEKTATQIEALITKKLQTQDQAYLKGLDELAKQSK